MKTVQNKIIQTIVVLFGVMLLAGCGGGGNNDKKSEDNKTSPVSSSLDKDFGTDGLVTAGGAGNDMAKAITIDHDGTLLVAGYMKQTPTGRDGALARYDADGKLQDAFGNHGVVVSTLMKDDVANAMAVDGSGNIFLAGYMTKPSGDKFAVIAKYKSDGNLDTTFDSNGARVIGLAGKSTIANAIMLDNQGRIIFAGSHNHDVFVARLKPNGSNDSTFGSGGGFVFGGAYDDVANDLTLDANQNILVAGTTRSSPSNQNIAVARITPTGTLDTTFGTGGIASFDNAGKADEAAAILVDGNGRILVTGKSGGGMAVARFTASGAPDTSFGTHGVVLDNHGMRTMGTDLILDADDNILITGVDMESVATYRMALWRFDPTGQPDTTFGDNGFNTYAGAYSQEWGTSIALDANDKIVVAGTSFQGPQHQQDMAIWRINP